MVSTVLALAAFPSATLSARTPPEPDSTPSSARGDSSSASDGGPAAPRGATARPPPGGHDRLDGRISMSWRGRRGRVVAARRADRHRRRAGRRRRCGEGRAGTWRPGRRPPCAFRATDGWPRRSWPWGGVASRPGRSGRRTGQRCRHAAAPWRRCRNRPTAIYPGSGSCWTRPAPVLPLNLTRPESCMSATPRYRGTDAVRDLRRRRPIRRRLPGRACRAFRRSSFLLRDPGQPAPSGAARQGGRDHGPSAGT